MSKRWRTKVCYVFEARKRKGTRTGTHSVGHWAAPMVMMTMMMAAARPAHTHTHTHVQTPEHTQLNVEKFDLQPQSKETKEMVDMVKRC